MTLLRMLPRSGPTLFRFSSRGFGDSGVIFIILGLSVACFAFFALWNWIYDENQARHSGKKKPVEQVKGDMSIKQRKDTGEIVLYQIREYKPGLFGNGDQK